MIIKFSDVWLQKATKVFGVDQEKSLVKYLLKFANLYHGLSHLGVRKLAYQFAIQNECKMLPNWETRKLTGPG